MPFYRLAPIDPSCAGGEAARAPAPAPSRRDLTAWVANGPFPGHGDLGAREDFLEVARLSAAPAPAPGWNPIQTREAFVDLDAAFGAAPGQGDAPRWTCAYAATTVSAPAARDAYLEVAGSDDPMRVWLNGEELTSGPLTVGSEAKRRPVRLLAGENLLVVQSCDLLGAWYFFALLTDAAGNDLPDPQYAAALPGAPIALPPRDPAADVQVIEGFAELVRGPNRHETHRGYRGSAESWWVAVAGPHPELAWRTAPVPAKRRTLAALTASMSFLRGDAELFVGDRSVLRFPIGDPAVDQSWEANGYRAAFIGRPYGEDNSGILLISVPAEAVTPGAPLDLRLRLTGGAPDAWFMIKAYPDTAAYEQLSGGEVHGMRSLWETAPPPRPAAGTDPPPP
jgi:hypothetical protein